MRTLLRNAIALSILFTVVSAWGQGDPRLWDTDGVTIRQGYHLEWNHAGDEDDNGNVVYAWSDTRTSDRDVYAQRINSQTGLKSWGSYGMAIVTAFDRQEDPAVVHVGNGQFIIAWNDFRFDAENGDLYAQKIDANGNKLWSPSSGVLLSDLADLYPSTEDQGAAQIRMISDGSGGAVLVWQDMRNGDLGDLYAIRVLSDGTVPTSWGLNSGVTVVAVNAAQHRPTVDTDGSGGVIVAWRDDQNQLVKGLDVRLRRVTSTGQVLWGGSDGALIGGAFDDQDSPKLCPDGFGGAFVVWVDKRNGNEDLYFQHVPSSGPLLADSMGRELIAGEGKQLGARIVADGSHHAIIVWQDNADAPSQEWFNIYAQKVDTSEALLWNLNGVGVCVQDPDNVNQEDVRLNADGAGGAVCTWTDSRNGEYTKEDDIYAQRINADGSPAWTLNGVPVTQALGEQSKSLVRAAPNFSFVAWLDQRSGSDGLWYQKLQGTTGARLLSDLNGDTLFWGLSLNADLPTLVQSTEGRIFIFFEDQRFLDPVAIVQIQDTLGNVLLEPNGRPICDTPASAQQIGQRKISACSDGVGGAVAIWVDKRLSDYTMVGQRINSSGDLLWGTFGLELSTTAGVSDQVPSKVIQDGAGGWFAAWTTAGGDPKVSVRKISPNGTLGWLTQISYDPTDDDLESLAADGSGGVYVAEISGQWGEQRLMVQHLDASGNPLWGATGIPLTPVEETFWYGCSIVSFGSQGAIFVWDDRRNNTDLDLYAQKVSFTGEILWQQDGFPLCTAPEDQTSQQLAVDSDSNVFIVWSDFRSATTYDLYLQKLSPTGSLLFPADVPICTYPSDQEKSRIVNDERGGCYIFWEEKRPGPYYDIYGTHVDESGNLASTIWQPDGNVICNYYRSQTDIATVADFAQGAMIVWVDERSSGKELLHDLFSQRVNDFGAEGIVPWDKTAQPAAFQLFRPYPNPFNPEVQLRYSLNRPGFVRLAVYDLLGREVALLREGWEPQGAKEITWKTQAQASGLYLVRLTFADQQQQEKVLLLK